MEIQQIAELVQRNATQFRDNGVTGVFAYGSRARGDHRPESDLDLFIDYDPDIMVPSLLRLVGMEQKLSDELGIPVSITTRRALHPRMKQKILKDAVRLMERDPIFFVEDAIGEIEVLEQISADLTFERFSADPVTFRAAAFAIMAISEAVRHFPQEWIDAPHDAMATDQRHRQSNTTCLFQSRHMVLWQIIQQDAPALKTILLQMRAAHQP